jgi:hypothetical protein
VATKKNVADVDSAPRWESDRREHHFHRHSPHRWGTTGRRFAPNRPRAPEEPTYSNDLRTISVHPQLGREYLAPLGQEIIVKGGGLPGFIITAPAADGRGSVCFQE